jgi:hypothetical protein
LRQGKSEGHMTFNVKGEGHGKYKSVYQKWAIISQSRDGQRCMFYLKLDRYGEFNGDMTFEVKVKVI